MKTITIQIPDKGNIVLRLGNDVQFEWGELEPDRLVRAILAWLALVDLSRRLNLTEEEAKELEEKIREGIRRRVKEMLQSSTPT